MFRLFASFVSFNMMTSKDVEKKKWTWRATYEVRCFRITQRLCEVLPALFRKRVKLFTMQSEANRDQQKQVWTTHGADAVGQDLLSSETASHSQMMAKINLLFLMSFRRLVTYCEADARDLLQPGQESSVWTQNLKGGRPFVNESRILLFDSLSFQASLQYFRVSVFIWWTAGEGLLPGLWQPELWSFMFESLNGYVCLPDPDWLHEPLHCSRKVRYKSCFHRFWGPCIREVLSLGLTRCYLSERGLWTDHHGRGQEHLHPTQHFRNWVFRFGTLRLRRFELGIGCWNLLPLLSNQSPPTFWENKLRKGVHTHSLALKTTMSLGFDNTIERYGQCTSQSNSWASAPVTADVWFVVWLPAPNAVRSKCFLFKMRVGKCSSAEDQTAHLQDVSAKTETGNFRNWLKRHKPSASFWCIVCLTCGDRRLLSVFLGADLCSGQEPLTPGFNFEMFAVKRRKSSLATAARNGGVNYM